MKRPRKHFRILAIALSTRGFGFVVMEGQNSLIEWGVKVVDGDKNMQSLARVEKLIAFYQPGVLVLQDVEDKGSRRGPRIKTLHRQIIRTAGKHKLKVASLSRIQLRRLLLSNTKGTKHEMAEMIADQFPNELALRLPAKRRPWKSEDDRMYIFDAAALAVAFRMRGR